MPSGDRTGPQGQGPGTGRQLGYCSGYESPGHTKGFGKGRNSDHFYGRGMGRGSGRRRGRGFGGFHYAQNDFIDYARGSYPQHSVNKEDELQMLKSRAEALNNLQKDLQKRIENIENQ